MCWLHSQVRTFLQCAACVTRVAGLRAADWLPRLLPLVVRLAYVYVYLHSPLYSCHKLSTLPPPPPTVISSSLDTRAMPEAELICLESDVCVASFCLCQHLPTFVNIATAARGSWQRLAMAAAVRQSTRSSRSSRCRPSKSSSDAVRSSAPVCPARSPQSNASRSPPSDMIQTTATTTVRIMCEYEYEYMLYEYITCRALYSMPPAMAHTLHSSPFAHYTHATAEGTDAMDTDSGEGDSADGADLEGDADGEADEYSDDEDLSWKVRRAAARTLQALVVAAAGLRGGEASLAALTRSIGPPLLARFKEREENVRIDIIDVYLALLRMQRPLATFSAAGAGQSLAPASGAGMQATIR